MKNNLLDRAISCLAHPINLIAIVLLLLNDHFLKYTFPSWWTGKLSDFTWLSFAPVLLIVPLAVIIPSKYRQREQAISCFAFSIVGAAFILIKTIPSFQILSIRVFETLNSSPVEVKKDPTDLLALPALFVGWHAWNKAHGRLVVPLTRGWIMVMIGSLATIATVNEPESNFGVACLTQGKSMIITSVQENSTVSFSSSDGGLTWQELEPSSNQDQFCTEPNAQSGHPWRITDPATRIFNIVFALAKVSISQQMVGIHG